MPWRGGRSEPVVGRASYPVTMSDRTRMRLTMWTGADDRETVDVPGPGGTIRVAVGEPGHRSGVWRIWSNATTSDVFVAGRTIAGVIKWSLHESGDWRHAFTTAFARRAGIDQRVLDRWEAPSPDESGWQRGLCILVAARDVIDVPLDTQRSEGVTWLPEPLDGAVTYIHVIVARPDEGVATGIVPVGAFSLADGRAVIVGAAWRVNTVQEDEDLASLRSSARARVASSTEAAPTGSGIRLSAMGHNEYGHRVVWDMAYDVADG